MPFFVTLRLGEERVIARNGALELLARCILGSGTSGNRLDLVVTSTLDGWLATSAGRSTTTEQLAGDEVVLFTAATQPGQGRLSGFPGDGLLTGAQLALAPDGSFLAVASGSTALGVDLFDQDCLAVGTASLIRGELPSPLVFGQQSQPVNGISGGVASGGAAVGVAIGAGTSSSGDTLGGGISQLAGGGISGLGGGGISQPGGGISGLGGGGISGLGGGGISQLGGGGISGLGGGGISQPDE